MNTALKWGLILLLAIVLIIMLGRSHNSGNSNNSSVKSSPTPLVTPQAPEHITAQELADDFDQNAVAAKARWQGRFVEFEVQVSNITDDGISFYNVGSKQFSLTQIKCEIKDKNQLLPLVNGQDIRIKGVVREQVIGVIEIGSCEVVS